MKYNLLRFLGHITFLRFGLRERLIRYFANPDKKINYSFTVKFYNTIYKGNLNCYLDWNVYFYGAYEKSELLFYKKILKKIDKPVVVDIGANIGHHTLFFSNFSFFVYSFEPYEFVRKSLIDKLFYNNIKNVVIEQFGLSDSNDTIEFYAPTLTNTGTGSFIKNHAIDNNIYFKNLDVKIGDEYFMNLNLSNIDFIKIDVEGFESKVINGLFKTISKYRPIISMEYEYDSKKGFGNKYIKEFLPEGYQIFTFKSNIPFLLFNQFKYKLIKFDKNDIPNTILICPIEKLYLIK